MYTRCPECDAYFPVTAAQLSAAHGEVRCVHCDAEFDSLPHLVDKVPGIYSVNDDRGEVPDDLDDHNDRGEVPDLYKNDDTRGEVPDLYKNDDTRGEVPDLYKNDDTRGEVPDLYKNDDTRGEVPDDASDSSTWPYEPDETAAAMPTFIVVGAAPAEDEPADAHDPVPFVVPEFLRNPMLDADIDADPHIQEIRPGADELPPWLAGEPETEAPAVAERPPPALIVAVSVLAVMLIGQLLHHNRDALAASPGFGGAIQKFYSGFGSTLYPEWPLNSFEIRGTEAVAGGGQSPALKILAKILIVGGEPVGMPLIRVVLRDRWSDPVASGIFRPVEYLQSNAVPARSLPPGATLPIEIEVTDPGAEARGYVVDVCLPNRRSGLQCQLTKEPFLP